MDASPIQVAHPSALGLQYVQDGCDAIALPKEQALLIW